MGKLRVLATFARSRKLSPPERLGDAVGLVARLGGWLGRTRDPPGAQLMWHGYTQLVAMAFAFELRDEYGDRSKCGNSSLHTRAGLSRGTQCSGSGVSNDARARQRPWISAVSARADSRAA